MTVAICPNGRLRQWNDDAGWVNRHRLQNRVGSVTGPAGKIWYHDLPEPAPHPDHVKIGMNTGQAWVAGPMTKEGVAVLAMWRAKRVEWQAQLIDLRADREFEEDGSARQIIRDELTHTDRILAIIDGVLSVVD